MLSVRILLAVALFAPAVIGVIAPVISILRLRGRGPSRRGTVAGVLAVWIALVVAASVILQSVAFHYAWMWAHVDRPPRAIEQVALFAITTLVIIVLGGCAMALHRFLRRRLA